MAKKRRNRNRDRSSPLVLMSDRLSVEKVLRSNRGDCDKRKTIEDDKSTLVEVSRRYEWAYFMSQI